MLHCARYIVAAPLEWKTDTIMKIQSPANKLVIKNVMHPAPHTIGVEQTLAVAKTIMQEHNIRHVPVLTGREVIGVLTDRDVHFSLAVEKKPAESLRVEDAYTREPYIVTPNTPVDVVALKMAHDHIGCALIVEQGKLLGIFTAVDACRLLGEIIGGRVEQ